ncbi:hypothetical protein H7J77_12295 [Mycolicibacillus parakoreensis]|uniref:Uncharacterized protein n=1 Tax=Mycolicibacillus parakoreensis TaxID=1069221 RepID=A0ABY3TZB0_9MYCO|nr:hypothetical protein [Mycolicibacillus parakoreensis]MCV7316316.1 hypothetical protein [Mycolicibacillus parakoreensis]ULN52562.1 hypothetical protein MIU77_17275 [Mycolicibacillus parakoreensis]
MTDSLNDFDPRLGTVLDPYRPSRSLDARVKQLAAEYVARDRKAVHTLLDVCADALEFDQVPGVVTSLLEILAEHLTNAVGEPLAARRLAADAHGVRADIFEYGEVRA